MPEPCEYGAYLGNIEAYSCGLQGFDDRLYCMFVIAPDMPGSAADFFLYLNECEDPVFTQPNLTIPELQPSGEKCSVDLDKDACEAAGGTMSTGATTAPYCICP